MFLRVALNEPQCWFPFIVGDAVLNVFIFVSFNFIPFLMAVCCRQGMTLKSKGEFHKQAQRMWYPKCRMPVSQWLGDKHTKEDKARLKALGNVVMPQCAECAMHIIGHQAVGA